MATRAAARAIWAIAILLIAAVPARAAETVVISGAGATFPLPLYTAMFESYSQQRGIQVAYDAIGSGGGVKALIEKKVDFAGTDAFMADQEISKAGSNIVHIPICMGAVAVAYNLVGNVSLSLTPAVVADIFLGKIARWNDPRILSLNPQVKVSDIPITVVHRADGSGTTAIFTEYLSKVSPEWRERIGSGKTVKWATGQSGKGNPGVAGIVRQTMGAVGYVELIYAIGNSMKFASIQNLSGNFIAPSVESVSLAGKVAIPADTNISLTNTAAPHGYPISGFTWIAIYQQQAYGGRPAARARELVDLLWWMTHEGQSLATRLYYSPLSEEAVHRSEQILGSVRFGDTELAKP